MNANARLIQKNSKIFSEILLAVIIIMAILGSLNAFRFMNAGIHDNTSFSVKKNIDDFGEASYNLTINGNKFYNITLEKVPINMETGLSNYKVTYMLNRGIILINQIIFIVMFYVVYKMLKEITEKETAFSISNTKRLRAISFLILLLVLIPFMMTLTINFFVFLKASAIITYQDILLILISLAIWGTSYVMDYGCELQKEVDETL